MADDATIKEILETYHEPKMEECCGTCKHWDYDQMSYWCGLAGRLHYGGEDRHGCCAKWELHPEGGKND